MQRIRLNPGDTLEMNNRIYTIKSVLGDGATCVVYSACYKNDEGDTIPVNIKECYPYDADIIRNGFELSWNNSEEKTESLHKFGKTYENLMRWQDANEIASVFDICKLNNTQYIVMEPNRRCVTFEKDNPESLGDILKTIKLLAHYIGKFHQNGYLHLDIKPSNFLVYPRPSDHIILFDLDTVTAISDIEAGICKYFSYSDGWAAPEQKQGKINKLCPATDIYAIGAVLFEKIMGRQVNIDDIGYFAEWDFDGELFEDINPKIKRLLTNIFKKTLAASVKRRYQTADALIKDLNQAIKVAESEVYLKGDDICCSGYFVGREEELQKIKNSFDSKKKAVFLHGFGGIGKTEIARKYAEVYKKDYDTVLFVKYDCNSTLQEKLDEIDINNFEGDTAEHCKKLRSLLDDKTLVIVDNFDVEIGVDNGLKVLLDTKAHVLVSTRTDFSSVYTGNNYTQIEITELASSELEQVFLSNAKICNIKESEREFLFKIFKLIENHTYATELLAKQMYYSGWSFETLYDKVKSGFSSLTKAEKIVTNKDEDTIKDNSLNILRAVYRISDLTEDQKQVLRNMSLLQFINLSKNVYKELCYCDTLEYLNNVLELGYVQEKDGFISIHSLMKDLVDYELTPNWDNCKGVFSYVAYFIEWFKCCDNRNEADINEAIFKVEFISRFIKQIKVLDDASWLMIYRLLKYILIKDLKIGSYRWNKIDFYDLMHKCIEGIDQRFVDKKYVYWNIYSISCLLCSSELFEPKADNLEYREKEMSYFFSKLWRYFELTNDEENLERLSLKIFREMNMLTYEEEIEKFLKHIEGDFSVSPVHTRAKASANYLNVLLKVHKYKPEWFNLTNDGWYTYYGNLYESKTYRDFIKSHEEESIVEVPDYVLMIANKEVYLQNINDNENNDESFDDFDFTEFEEDDDDEYWDTINKIAMDLTKNIDSINVIKSFLINGKYNSIDTIRIVDRVLYDFFHPFMGVSSSVDSLTNSINSKSLETIKYLLDIQSNFLKEQSEHLINMNLGALEENKAEECLDLLKYKTILFAFNNNVEFFDSCRILFDLCDNLQEYFFDNGLGFIGYNIDDVIQSCLNMKKSCLVVPILRNRLIEKISNINKQEHNDFMKHIREQYGSFEQLYRCAIQALDEVDSEKVKELLEEDISICSEMMKKLTNQKFELKDDILN